MRQLSVQPGSVPDSLNPLMNFFTTWNLTETGLQSDRHRFRLFKVACQSLKGAGEGRRVPDFASEWDRIPDDVECEVAELDGMRLDGWQSDGKNDQRPHLHTIQHPDDLIHILALTELRPTHTVKRPFRCWFAERQVLEPSRFLGNELLNL